MASRRNAVMSYWALLRNTNANSSLGEAGSRVSSRYRGELSQVLKGLALLEGERCALKCLTIVYIVTSYLFMINTCSCLDE